MHENFCFIFDEILKNEMKKLIRKESEFDILKTETKLRCQ